MSYASYSFYTDTYKGQGISAEEWPRLALQASGFLDYYTMGKAGANAKLKDLKMACCAIAEQYKLINEAQVMACQSIKNSHEAMGTDGGEIQSETVGPHSVSRRSGGDSAKAAQEAARDARGELANIARQYLAGTGLLYRGVGVGCTRRTP